MNKQRQLGGGGTAVDTRREVLFDARMEGVGVFTKQGPRTMLNARDSSFYKGQAQMLPSGCLQSSSKDKH